MTAPELSIIIPAYNAERTIGRQLASLESQIAPPTFDVIVADNRSTDATARAARTAAGALDLRVVPAVRAQGANCARNTAILETSAPLVLCIDADDELAPGALRAVVDAFDEDPTLDLATGVPSDEAPETFELPISMGFLPYGISAFLAIRREVFEEVDGFDEAFVGGQEEVDFCWRAQLAGFRLGIVRGARFTYEPRPDARSTLRQFRRYGETYVQLFVKHRERGLTPSTARAELRVLGGMPGSAWRLLRDPQNRRERARGLGWHLGRWQGHLRHRVWGPR